MLETIEDINQRLASSEISLEQAVRSTLALTGQGKVSWEEVHTKSAREIVEQVDNVSLRLAEDL